MTTIPDPALVLSGITSLQPAIDAASREVDELVDAADMEALAWQYHNLIVPALKAMRDLAAEAERWLVECAPWSGDTWQPDGLPIFEVRRGKDRKSYRWDEVRPYLRRAVLDPEQTGQLPDPEVVEAVDEAFDLMFAVAPLTGSTTPRVKALAPLLRGFDRDVDEFCDVKPGRVSIQIHGEA